MSKVSRPLLQRPSVCLPVVMSLLAFAVVAGHLAVYGAVREPDEGAVAHIWQLLMAGQLPFIAWHAVRWLPASPVPAAKVLAIQILGMLAAAAPVWWFRL